MSGPAPNSVPNPAPARITDFFPADEYKIINGAVIHRSGMSYDLSYVAKVKNELKKYRPHLDEEELYKMAIIAVERPWWAD